MRTDRTTSNRRAAALAGAVAVLAALNFLVIGSIASGGDDRIMTADRIDAVRAMLGIEAGTAVVLGELSAGRPVPTGDLELPGGHRVLVTSDAEYPPMTVELESRRGQSTRVVRIQID